MHICIYIYRYRYIRPTQSIMYVPLQVGRFQKRILLLVQYKYVKSCSRDFILQNLILRTRSCGTGFITQSSWVFHFDMITMVSWKCFIPQLYIYIYIYIYVFIYIYTCIYIYVCIYIYTYIYIYVCIYICVHIRI